jgi:hypothetical protein
LDNWSGRAAVGGREFNLAGASRFDKAAVVDDRKWETFRRREAARIGVDLGL